MEDDPDRRRRTAPASDAGSVLVDALVGLGVLAIVLTLASLAVQDGLQRTRSGEQTRLAALEAGSRLAEVGADIPLTSGRTSGVDGELNWTVSISPSEGGPGGSLLTVSVSVSNKDGRRLAVLHSLRTSA